MLDKDLLMSDLYLKAAQTQFGQSIMQTLNLPKPLYLKREESASLRIPAGNYLLAGCPKSFCLSSVLNTLHLPEINLDFFEGATVNFSERPKASENYSNTRSVTTLSEAGYNALIFDATGAGDTLQLASIYEYFHGALGALNTNGKILILAQDPQQLNDPLASSVQASIIGFCKSLAKECGRRAINCNVLYVQKGAQKYLDSSLAFFLSGKSAFITGQSVTIASHTLKQTSTMSDKPLAGKNALVTGAANGIGRETALLLARDGAHVICLDIPHNKESNKALAEQLNGLALDIDLLKADAVEQTYKALASQIGKLDIVVHNAGITRDKTLTKMSREQWDQVLTLNFERIVALNQRFIEQAFFNEHARIVCISSISGIAGNFGQTNYACSKAGIAAYVERFSQSTSAKKNSGMTINAIAPGFIETQMTQSLPFLSRELGRRLNAFSQGGLPLDVAEAVAYFCHPASHCLNGNLLRVCGLNLLGK